MLIYCAECFPALGSFPPERPRLRKRWFAALLQEAAQMRCVSSRGLIKVRMIKARHVNYLFYSRSLKGKQIQDLTIELLEPLALSVFYTGTRRRKIPK